MNSNSKYLYVFYFTTNSKGYPCGHVLTVIMTRNENFLDYVKPFFTFESYRNTYVGSIIHPNKANFTRTLQFNPETSDDLTNESETELTLPLSTRRPPGRPKKHCICNRAENVEDVPTRVQKCSRCKQSGHSKRTCKE